MDKQWMIYGATGYTGELISRAAKACGLSPVLAGRSVQKVTALAKEIDLPFRVFPLGKQKLLLQELQQINLVLNCAGPFSATAKPMMNACLTNGTHYLDITGEIDVFESAARLDVKARQNGCVICPGVGFDVIPTDCLAALLHSAVPDATHLALGFSSSSGPSAGTAKTSVEALSKGIRIRKDGRLTRVPITEGLREIDFGAGKRTAIRIPWGDVSTAFHSTGIPNIEVYIPFRVRDFKFLRLMTMLGPVLRFPPLRYIINQIIQKKVRGPSKQQLQTDQTLIWGEVKNNNNHSRQARFTTANGYQVTVDGSIAVVQKLLDQPPKTGGFFTPSELMGKHFAGTLPGSGEIEIT